MNVLILLNVFHLQLICILIKLRLKSFSAKLYKNRIYIQIKIFTS